MIQPCGTATLQAALVASKLLSNIQGGCLFPIISVRPIHSDRVGTLQISSIKNVLYQDLRKCVHFLENYPLGNPYGSYPTVVSKSLNIWLCSQAWDYNDGQVLSFPPPPPPKCVGFIFSGHPYFFFIFYCFLLFKCMLARVIWKLNL